jgi:acetoin utilization deacetylase AcuC-like enzyme
MITVYGESHRAHDAQCEFLDGRLQRIYERPERAERVIQAVRGAGLGPVRAPLPFERDLIARAHDPGLVRFLEEAWSLWSGEVGTLDAIPFAHCARGMQAREPQSINGRLSFYALDTVTPMTAGTWEAALNGVAVALDGLELVRRGERAAFSLCRPPGHHSMKGQYGGYCLFNNVAVAAQAAVDAGAGRVAILDVDYHHGNGTQDIFYERSDVLFVSIHADPRLGYPFFLGYADETGRGAGEGFNLNIPLPHGTDWTTYEPALAEALRRVRAYGPDLLLVSLGVDTYEHEPLARFKLRTVDYPRLGAAIASLRLPTLFVMEGGYDMEAIGRNVVEVLGGFENA